MVTHNLAITTTMNTILSTAACPAMCAGMCGVFLLSNHLSSKNHKKNQMLERKATAIEKPTSNHETRYRFEN
jgi:hypothetical protein